MASVGLYLRAATLDINCTPILAPTDSDSSSDVSVTTPSCHRHVTTTGLGPRSTHK